MDVEINTPLVLTYAGAEPPPPRRNLLIALLLVIPAVVSNFLPFTAGVAPISAYNEFAQYPGTEALIALAFGFSAAFPLILLNTRALIPYRAGRIERSVWTILALVFAAPGFYVIGSIAFEITQDPHNGSTVQFAPYGLCLAVHAWGVFLTIVLFRGRPIAALSVFLMSAYISNAGLALLSFYQNSQIGFWVSAVAVAGLCFLILRESLSFRRPASSRGI